MNIEEFRSFCLSLKEAEEGMPFDKKTLVFTIKGKMFTLTNIETFELINVKCIPEEAIILREQFDAVIPGYYMNKKHWNSIKMDSPIPDKQIKEWIKNSYDLVVSSLPKKIQKELQDI
ncbi:MAG: MmcQ/YjbR family DNA-binding protein [Bacteroidales bacterium]|nr:MmcQ/YjbR family DNA-binding protein [Bacteroidales bacterium]